MRRSKSILLARLLTLALLAAPSALAPAATQAAPKQGKSEQVRERAARRACLNGDYTKGVAVLSDLFLDTRDPTYIFNQGRCFEQNRRYEEAIARFEEYLRASENPQLDEADKAAAEKHIADCRERLGLPARPTETAAVPTQPQPAIAQPQPVVAEPQPSPVAALAAQPTATPSSSSGSGLRVAGIITASVGAAALVAGVLLNAKVNGMASDMESNPGAYSAGKESDRKTYETLGWAGYGVGAACLVTGAVLYIVGLKSAKRGATSAALVPTVGMGQAGAMLQGAF